MPHFCCVINCSNRSERNKNSYFRLPSVLKRGGQEKIRLSEKRRDKWLSAIKRSDIATEDRRKWLRVCGDHFITGKPAALEDVDHPDWAPSINLGYGKNLAGTNLHRYERTKKREEEKRKRAPDNEPDNELHIPELGPIDNIVGPEKSSVSVQTDLTMADISNLQKAYEDTVIEVTQTKNKLKKLSIDISSFENNDEKTRYYSGLSSFKSLIVIYKVVEYFLLDTSRSSLSKFEQLILTLMHLRLNLDFTDLGYRFGVSKQTASRIFLNCLSILYERLDRFVLWPEREDLMKKVPEVFLDAFGRKVTVIIDCFEIFIEKPSNVLAAAQTYSNYKSHNTVKYLIAISPQGVITFISSAWGGRSSDKFVVQNCGILEKLVPGDFVIADRGFNVKDEFRLYCAELMIPPFTKGKKQLQAVEIESTRNLAHVRIHVERVIGTLRQKYRILHSVMPISLVSKEGQNGLFVIDQIVTVCCCLTNVSVSVVPFD